jgi:YD repeat-containing protein
VVCLDGTLLAWDRLGYRRLIVKLGVLTLSVEGVVIRKILGIAVVLVPLSCAFSPTSAAQNTNPCLAITMWWFGDPLLPGWYFYGPGEGPFSWAIAAPTAKCAPAPCIPCGDKAGLPISLDTGNTFVTQPDVRVPGLGGGLSLVRTWNSLWPQSMATRSVGLFGPNWRSTYEESIFVGSDHYIKYARSDGSFWSFGVGGPAYALAAPSNVSATMVQDGTTWTLTFQNGEQRKFSFSTGLLTAIIDRNGNTTQLSYDGSNRLVTVTSPASQHLYFNYGSGATANLVTSVTSDFGVTLSYAYDPQGRLNQVTKPDQTTVSFTYNTQSEITAVTDNNGKVLESHTYDSSGRGLTSSRANGVESLTVTYP